MLRLLILALLIWSTLRLAGRIIRGYLESGNAGQFRGTAGRPGSAATNPPGAKGAKAGVLIRCKVCGTHFAGSDSSPGERDYCSERCRQTASDRP